MSHLVPNKGTVIVIINVGTPPTHMPWPRYEKQLKEMGLTLIVGNSLEEIKEAAKACPAGSGIKDAMALVLTHGCNAEIVPTLLKEATSVRWVHSWLAGVDVFPNSLFEDLLGRPSVTFTCGRGAFGQPLAEWILGVMMHFAKDMARLVDNKKNKKWEQLVSTRLQGQTVGFLGFGDIATRTALLVKAFGMRVIALRNRIGKQSGSPVSNESPLFYSLSAGVIKSDPATAQGQESVADEVYAADNEELRLEVFRKSDYIINCLPLTSSTKDFVSMRELSVMKPSAVIINVGRGGTMDEAALAEALKAKTIRGAGLDVFKEEPLPTSSPLWEIPNLVISSHSAEYVENVHDDAYAVLLDNLKAFLNGARTEKEFSTPVDKVARY